MFMWFKKLTLCIRVNIHVFEKMLEPSKNMFSVFLEYGHGFEIVMVKCLK
jgi:hypothetical protein